MKYGKRLNPKRSLKTPKGRKGTRQKSNCHSQPQ